MSTKVKRTSLFLSAVLLVLVTLVGMFILTSVAVPTQTAQVVEAVANSSPAAMQVTAVPASAQSPVSADPSRIVSDRAALEEAQVLVAAYEDVLNSIYQRVLPSVVHIQVRTQVSGGNGLPFDHPNLPEDFFGGGEGSGFVWDDQGHIVTNNHVVDNATQVVVLFADGTRTEAEVLGTDPNADLAVIKVDVPAEGLLPVPLGDSSQLRVGQLAVALGNPFGLENSMTSGIISALNRSINSGQSSFSIPEVIQTDAPINPGNSGGPLLNRLGEVVGINTQIVSRSGSNAGIGFAVPINIAKRVVPELITEGSYEYAWLGISGQTVTPAIAELMKLPEETEGALVMAVVEDGPADEAGLRGSDERASVDGAQARFGGDIIVAIDDKPVRGMEDLIVHLTDLTRPGDTVKLKVIRSGGETTNIDVILGARPSTPD